MDKTRNILVAWDFSDVAVHALEHAFIFAQNAKIEIRLLHIVSKESEIKEASIRMQKSVDDIFASTGTKVNSLVEVGNIFTTINQVAKDNSSMIVLMGTHGIKGMQKLTGSWALKVVAGSTIPYIIVHKAPIHKQYDSIVFPINFKVENKEKLYWAEFLTLFFKAKIFFITPKVNDETYTKRIKANLLFSRKYMEARNIEYHIKTSTHTSNYGEETVKYAKEISADIILIMTTKNIGIQDYILAAGEQYIIDNNEDIPVMCINPRTDLSKLTMFY